MTGGAEIERDAERAHERLRALADTMRAFVESTGDYQALLQTIADRVIRDLGDACLIGVLTDDGMVEPVALTSRDEGVKAAMRAAFIENGMKVAQMGVSMGVIATGKSVLIADTTPEELSRIVHPAFVEIVLRAGLRGIVSVPLEVHGQRIGALAVFRCRPESPPFGEADLVLCRGLGDHAALAIANARLLDSHRRELAERRRAEEEAKTFVALVENSTDFIAMAGFDGQVLFVNDAGRKLVGLDPAVDVRTLSLADFHTREALGRAAIIRRQGSWRGEGTLRHFGGGPPIPVRVSSFVVRDARGEPLCFATVQQDVRATQALEMQLRQAQKMEAIGQLAGGIAHDFNNLLSIILSYSAMLAPSFREGSPEQADLRQVELAGRRAAALTRQLLAFSRQQVLEPKVLDVNAVVTGIHAMLRRTVSEDIELRIVLAPDLAKVEADEGQIEQVIMNLVVNARDATPAGGVVTITTANVAVAANDPLVASGLAPGAHVTFAVRDEGVGIDEATKAHIFEPFFTTKAVGKGTGLGLATVLGIVKQSGGHVFVESEPRQGATFRVYLPPVAGNKTPTYASSLRPMGRAVGGTETILLVDDDAQVRALMQNVLVRAGYDVVEAAGPEEALAALQSGRRDVRLLVTDVIMPKMSGRELAERIQALLPRARVLYVSGYMEDAIGHHGVLEPGIQLLRKPLTPDLLLRKVRDVLDDP
ncbi:MAG TPA: ATP-binding protein [Polyangiaceae bacterium]